MAKTPAEGDGSKAESGMGKAESRKRGAGGQPLRCLLGMVSSGTHTH